MNQPLVSLLMTAYNRENYIAEAIQSVLNSSYANWELIIVDDGSTDNTVKIASDFATKDARIQVYINEKNLSDYPNRNKAAGYAKGEYLKYVDSDDMIYPWALELIIEQLEKHKEVAYALDSIAQDNDRMFPIILTPAEAYDYHYGVNAIFAKSPASGTIRTEVFRAVNGFTEERMVSDFEMWHRLSMQYKVLIMPHGMVWCRIHAGQEMADYRKNSYFGYRYTLISESYLKNPDCPISEELRQKTLKQIGKNKAKMFIKAIVKERDFKKAKGMLKDKSVNLRNLF